MHHANGFTDCLLRCLMTHFELYWTACMASKGRVVVTKDVKRDGRGLFLDMYQEKYENPQPEQSVFTVTSLMISE
jgi:hypothetical protein